VYLQTANAQMGVNSTGAVPNAAAMLDVRSSDKGFLMPRMTTTQRNAMPAIADGLMIYNTTTAEIEVYRGLFGWQTASRMGVPFTVTGSTVGGIVQASNTGSGFGMQVNAASGTGVLGISSTGIGVYGQGDQGVIGNGVTTGVEGTSGSGTGIFGSSSTFRGVWGRGLTTGDGVYGDATSGNAVRGVATTGTGVRGTGSQGVYGDGTTTGVFGTTTSGTGVFGRSDSFRGVWGRGITTGDGVYGDASTGKGVYGLTSSTGIGVFGSATAGGTGVQGISISGNGGYFQSDSYRGIEAYSLSNYAILASNTSASVPVAQLANLSGGTALELIASTAIRITGAIKVAGGSSAPAFKIVSSAGNILLNQLIIPNTTLANNTNDILMVTHNYGAGGPYLNKPFGVFWNGTNWTIYLEDNLAAMPVGATFNVLVIKQ
jgi:hypothetical protein